MKNATGRLAVAVAFALAFAAASLSRPPAAFAVLAMPEADSYTTAGAPRTFGASKVLRLHAHLTPHYFLIQVKRRTPLV